MPQVGTALFATAGQRSAALRQYETCCATLQRELGAEPSPQTEALYEQIRLGTAAEIAEEEVVAASEAPAETAATPGSEETARTYTVQSGDSLWKIAEELYGSGAKYQHIFEANRDILDDPDRIMPGQVLKIPVLDD